MGDRFIIKYGDNQPSFNVAGIVTTGAAEENQVFVALKTAQQLTGMTDKVGLVQVSARTDSQPLVQVSRLIEQNIPGTEARIIGQIAKAESQVLQKVQLLMMLVAGLILIASGLVILSTMTTTILERTKEIGLMKALGASDRRIIALYGTEIGIVAFVGGILGYLIGFLLARFIGQQVFNSGVSPSILAFFASITVAMLVTFTGSLLPLYRAAKVNPSATLLREE
ncbi:MAG: FtsX-like permease family protein [Dehalococcoidales bacterium]|nr:FtsX-like permease family protein [Dehalococcoidales bacterium]